VSTIWLDTLSRRLLQSGEFAELIRDSSVTGATSNPTIFAKAIEGSDLYDDQLRRLVSRGQRDTHEVFFSIALEDVGNAAELLRSKYDRTAATDGFISFECTPDLAGETDTTIAQAIDLWQRLDQRNVMIKVPGTEAGLPAIEELTRRGVNVNITLLFSIERYEQVIDAYLRGLRARSQANEPLDSITSVASFLLSRIDTKVDASSPPTPRCAAGWRWRPHASGTSATWPSSPARNATPSSAPVRNGSGRCGPVLGRRIRVTPMCSKSPS
jgi:transaldolase